MLQAGVRGAYIDNDGEDASVDTGVKRKYFRVMKSLDVSDDEAACQVESIIREVFNNLAMKCIVEGETADDDSSAASFIAHLRKLSNLHFAA